MAPGVEDIQGSTHGHDVIPVKAAIKYLTARGYPDGYSNILTSIHAEVYNYVYKQSTKEKEATRVQFGQSVSAVLDGFSAEENAKKVMVIDSGSTEHQIIIFRLLRSAQLILRVPRV